MLLLYKFNRYIKKEYDNSSPSLDWIEEFFNKKINLVNVKKLLLPGISSSTYEIRFPSLKRAIYIPELNYFCFF